MTTPSRRPWLLPAATLTLLICATAALAVATTLALTRDDQPDPATAASAPPTTGQPTTAPVPVTSSGGPVAELADRDWVARTAQATEIPQRALAAYAGASIAVAASQPTCGLGWNTLAAIGQVESEHGSMDGATLAADGAVKPAIIGVALDGDGVARIPDTDAGRIDRDTEWDHAVGPLQFLPTTWTAYAEDGNLDGEASIHNLDDAALSAAHYLCESGGDLSRPDNWIAAISAYNTGSAYNARVARAASAYAAAAEGAQR